MKRRNSSIDIQSDRKLVKKFGVESNRPVCVVKPTAVIPTRALCCNHKNFLKEHSNKIQNAISNGVILQHKTKESKPIFYAFHNPTRLAFISVYYSTAILTTYHNGRAVLSEYKYPTGCAHILYKYEEVKDFANHSITFHNIYAQEGEVEKKTNLIVPIFEFSLGMVKSVSLLHNVNFILQTTFIHPTRSGRSIHVCHLLLCDIAHTHKSFNTQLLL